MTSTESAAIVDTTGEVDGDHAIPANVPPIPSDRASTKAIATTLDEYKEKYQLSITNPNQFWFQQASERISWFTFPFDANANVCQGSFKNGDVTWFANAKLNVCYNAIDRHVNAGDGDKVALIWEGDETDETSHVTFRDMQNKISQICHVLASHGVTKGSVVTIYMPMSTSYITIFTLNVVCLDHLLDTNDFLALSFSQNT
jgi:acetyl-CoA synthetase